MNRRNMVGMSSYLGSLDLLAAAQVRLDEEVSMLPRCSKWSMDEGVSMIDWLITRCWSRSYQSSVLSWPRLPCLSSSVLRLICARPARVGWFAIERFQASRRTRWWWSLTFPAQVRSLAVFSVAFLRSSRAARACAHSSSPRSTVIQHGLAPPLLTSFCGC